VCVCSLDHCHRLDQPALTFVSLRMQALGTLYDGPGRLHRKDVAHKADPAQSRPFAP